MVIVMKTWHRKQDRWREIRAPRVVVPCKRSQRRCCVAREDHVKSQSAVESPHTYVGKRRRTQHIRKLLVTGKEWVGPAYSVKVCFKTIKRFQVLVLGDCGRIQKPELFVLLKCPYWAPLSYPINLDMFGTVFYYPIYHRSPRLSSYFFL